MKNLLLLTCLIMLSINSFSQCTATAVATPVLCFGFCDGSATVIATGPSPFTYQWNTSPPQTNQSATGLCAGNYTVLVTDAGGISCTANVTINSPTVLVVNMSSTPASCGGCTDGTATSFVTGGTPAYSYQWDAATGNQITSTATGLIPGVYTLCVADGNGCTTCAPVTVTFATGIDVQASSSISIYPNPTENWITVSLEEGTATSVTIRNSLGQLLLSDKIKTTNQVALDLSSYPTGIYFLQLEVDGQVITKKVVKE